LILFPFLPFLFLRSFRSRFVYLAFRFLPFLHSLSLHHFRICLLISSLCTNSLSFHFLFRVDASRFSLSHSSFLPCIVLFFSFIVSPHYCCSPTYTFSHYSTLLHRIWLDSSRIDITLFSLSDSSYAERTGGGRKERGIESSRTDSGIQQKKERVKRRERDLRT